MPEVKAPNPDVKTATDKPDSSPPQLRRRKAATEGEARAYYEEKTRDGRLMTDEEFTRMEEFTADILQLNRQIDVAERWLTAEGVLGHNRTANGRVSGNMPLMPYEDQANTRNGRLGYSIIRALRSRMDPAKYPLEGIELETQTELNKMRIAAGMQSARGILIPNDLPIDLRASIRWAKRNRMGQHVIDSMVEARAQLSEQRALDTTAGAGSIPTIVDTTMIELLRPRMVTFGMGARVMTDMQGLFAIPRQQTAATFYMVTQGGSVTASNQTIDQVPFSPHTGGAYTTYTRQFLEQTNQDAEMFVREDLSAVVARGVETAAFNGQGSLGYPVGLLQNGQIGIYALGTNGAAPTWTMLISMASFVAYFNADVGSLSFVCDALTRGTLQLTLKVSGSTFPIYLWNTDGGEFPLAGYRCPVTNLLPGNIVKGTGTSLKAMIFGNWEDLVYAFWSGLDAIVDPYTAAPQGAVNIIVLQDFDVNERHYQSFANCVDIISSITAPVT